MYAHRTFPALIAFAVAIASLLGGCADASSSSRTGEEEDAPPLRVLYLTGGGWHDYDAQKALLPAGLDARIDRIDWTIVHEGQGAPDHKLSVLQEEGWAEEYDVIVHNHAFGRLEDADFVADVVEQHRGTPAVVIHAANHSFRYSDPADPWFSFLGQQSMRHEGQRPLQIENLAPTHPIMQDLPAEWETPVDDELYVVEDVWGDITPLARAYGEETDTHHVVAWTHEIQDTRVFSTTLGHNNGMYEHPAFLDLIANGLRWAVGDLDA